MPRTSAAAALALILAGCASERGELPDGASESYWVLVADKGADRVVALEPNGRWVGVVADQRHGLSGPSCARLGADGSLYVTNFDDGNVLRIDVATGVVETFYSDSWLEEPVALAFSPDTVFALGNDSRSAIKLDRGGALLATMGYPTMRDPHDMHLGPDGGLYVIAAPSGRAAGAVQMWNAADESLETSFGDADQVERATSLAFDPDGNLHVADHARDRIVRFDLGGRFLGELALGEHALDRPVQIAFAPNGALYALDAAGLKRLERTTGALEAMVRATGDGLVDPRGVSFVPAGAVPLLVPDAGE
jgi:DNA-binding beta-propeller fold protein YncE